MVLKDKVVIITGASSGIGKELAYQLARGGNAVVLAARSRDALQRIVSDLKSRGRRVLAVPTDVTRRDQVHLLAHEALTTFGRIDVWINNAGVSTANGTLMENREVDVRQTWETNFMAGVYGVWEAVPAMEKNGGGLIVFVSSVVALRGIPRNAVYCASKFAIDGLAESIRLELAAKKIRVLTVYPPGTDTPFYENNKKGPRRTYPMHSTEKISRLIIRACERNRAEDFLTWDGRLLHWLNFFIPRPLDIVIARVKNVKR